MNILELFERIIESGPGSGEDDWEPGDMPPETMWSPRAHMAPEKRPYYPQPGVLKPGEMISGDPTPPGWRPTATAGDLPPGVRIPRTDVSDDDQPKTQAAQDVAAAEAGEDVTGGHKRFVPKDLTGKDPQGTPYPGQIAPRLAGERARIAQAAVSAYKFIEKYEGFATEEFKSAPAAHNVPWGTPDDTGKVTQGRIGARGGVRGFERVISKDDAMAILEELPMAPSDEIMTDVKKFAGYVWRVHAQVRSDIREMNEYMLGQREGFPFKKKKVKVELINPFTKKKIGDAWKWVDTDKLDTEHPAYKENLEALSREFEIDSVQIKSDINTMMSAAGVLKKSGGFGGEADATYLERGADYNLDKDDRTGIVAKPATAKLTPALQDLVGDFQEPLRRKPKRGVPLARPGALSRPGGPKPLSAAPASAGGTSNLPDELPDEWFKDLANLPSRPAQPTAAKPLGAPKPAMKPVDPRDLPDELPDDWFKDWVDRKIGTVIEQACADRAPRWWDDL